MYIINRYTNNIMVWTIDGIVTLININSDALPLPLVFNCCWWRRRGLCYMFRGGCG